MKLKGITVIVTGPSSGIGKETARHFARAGSNVVLASRSARRLEELAQELERLPGRRLVVSTDVTDHKAVNAMVERALSEFDSIDVLVNNAGVGLSAPIAEASLDNIRYVFDVNLIGAIHCIQAVTPHMKERRRGAIINVSSVVGRLATPYNGGYSATKAALNAITDSLRLELEPWRIKVTAVYPGNTITEFQENSLRELEMPHPSRMAARIARAVGPEAVAKTIVRAVRDGQREAYVSLTDAAAVMIKNLSPRLVDWGMRRTWLSSRPPKTTGER